MKRLFGFLFVISLFFTFSHTSFAAVTKEQFDEQVNALYNNEVKSVFQANNNLNFIQIELFKNKLFDAAQPIFVEEGSKDETTTATIRALVAGTWRTLAEKLSTNSSFSSLEKSFPYIIPNLGNASIQAAISDQQQKGNITTEQATAARGVASQNQAKEVNALKEPKTEVCKFSVMGGESFSLGVCISEFVTFLIKKTFLEIAGFFLWVSTTLFAYSVEFGILGFKKLASDQLYPLWVLIRQIISLGVVFIGLFLGFMYTIGKEEKFQRYLPWLVVFALFVNFSYPLARFAIDISNIISLNTYAATFGNEAFSANTSASVGGKILNSLGLNDLVAAATKDANGEGFISKISTPSGALITVAFVGYAAYVFFMATALMVMRTVVLILMIVASPFLLIDSVLPIFGESAMKIRKVFFEQLVVAPVFMILMALTFKFINIFQGNVTAITSDGSSSLNKGSDISLFFSVLITIVMLHVTLKITKKVAGDLGQMATNFAGKVGGFAMGGVGGLAARGALGGAGILARNTIGKRAAQFRDSSLVQRNQNNFLGRRAFDMANAFAKSSYDLRNSKTVAGGLNRLGLKAGTGRTDGYEEAMEKRRQDILTRGQRIKTHYEKDVIDPKTGQILHKKGAEISEGKKAYDEYMKSGGGALFMPKEEKEKARTAMYEAQEKKKLEEYTKLETKAEKDKFEKGVTDQIQTLIQSGKDYSDPEVASLNRLLGGIGEKRKERDKEIEKLLYQYQNMYGKTAEEVEENRKKFLSKLNKEDKESVQEKLNGSGGDAFKTRQERVKKVEEGRQSQLEEYQAELEMRKLNKEVSTENKIAGIAQINKKWNDNLTELKNLGTATQEEIDDLEQRRGEEIKKYEDFINRGVAIKESLNSLADFSRNVSINTSQATSPSQGTQQPANTPWFGQNTNIPAFQRKAQAAQSQSTQNQQAQGDDSSNDYNTPAYIRKGQQAPTLSPVAPASNQSQPATVTSTTQNYSNQNYSNINNPTNVTYTISNPKTDSLANIFTNPNYSNQAKASTAANKAIRNAQESSKNTSTSTTTSTENATA